MTSEWVWAAVWGTVAGAALIIGAVAGYTAHIPQRLTAGVMAFGSGVLVSALSFELMEDAYQTGGGGPAVLGFLGGAALFTGANWVLARHGGKHRKRSGDQQAQDAGKSGSGLAIAAGSLLDGIPESLAIGLSMVKGGAVSAATVAAVFLSNIPEGLSSAAGMRRSGRSAGFVFLVWGAIAAACGLSSLAGYTLFHGLPDTENAAVSALAAGAILAMLADTMIPEAFEQAHNFTGFITGLGFLLAFIIGKL